MLISLSLHIRDVYTSLTWTLGRIDEDDQEQPALETEILSDTQLAEPEPDAPQDERATLGFRRTDQ